MNLRIAKKWSLIGMFAQRDAGHVEHCPCLPCRAWRLWTRTLRRRRKNHPTTKAWRAWAKECGSEWDKVDDIEAELGRGED